METIKDRIRIARKARKMSQEALAAAMGVARISALNWESKTKKAHPEQHRLPLLAETLGVRMEWLMTGRAPMTEAPEAAPVQGDALDRALMYRVLVALERYFVERELAMTPEDRAETALAVYEWAEAEGAPETIDIARISSLLRLANPKRRLS